jgi:hypothetical protein
MGEVIYMRASAKADILLTKRELAARWKVSTRWIELRVKHDGLPMQKDRASRLVRFSWFAVEQWRTGRLVSSN